MITSEDNHEIHVTQYEKEDAHQGILFFDILLSDRTSVFVSELACEMELYVFKVLLCH